MTSFDSRLDAVHALFADDEIAAACGALAAVLRDVDRAAPEAAFTSLLTRLDDDVPIAAAHFAFAAAALLELGVSPARLGRAAFAPYQRALADAARFIAACKKLEPLSPDDERDDDDVFELGARPGAPRFPFEAVQEIAAADPRAAQAFEAVATWCGPMLATWRRDVEPLRAAQADAAFVALVDVVAGADVDTERVAAMLRAPRGA